MTSDSWYDTITTPGFLIALAIGVAAASFLLSRLSSSAPANTPAASSSHAAGPSPASKPASKVPAGATVAEKMSVMSAPNADLAPPKDDPITVAQLAEHDGKDSSKPIYVAIKGRVYDVSNKKEMYGPGAGYNVFAGKDASRGLGMSSLDPKDAVADYSTLNEAQMKTLDQWDAFFAKRYNIVGKVVP